MLLLLTCFLSILPRQKVKEKLKALEVLIKTKIESERKG